MALSNLFELVMKAIEVTPDYSPSRCLNATEGAGSCTTCLDVCPHQAITLPELVEVDGVDCTGCGLCVRACPSQALEMSTKISAAAGVRCSQVGGSAPTVRCLAQLSPTDIYRLGIGSGHLELAHGDCLNCKIGDASAPAVASQAAEQAAQLARLLGRELQARIGPAKALDDAPPQRRVSRRQLFGAGLKDAKRMAAEAVAPLERLLPEAHEEGQLPPLPTELGRTYRAIQLAQPEGSTLVPWRLPRVDDGCILCPACTRACPTNAFSRDFSGPEGALKLAPDRCVGCDACVRACPVQVISMDDQVTWNELSGGTQEAYRASPDKRADGSFHR